MASFTKGSSSATKGAADAFQSVDLGGIRDLDPSVADGFTVVYDREVPLEVRLQGQSTGSVDVGTSEAVKVKILLLGDVTAPKALRIELSSENDLFFFYWHVVDSQGFTVIQEQQKLMADFSDFAGILIKMLNNCIKETHHYLAVFVMMKDGQARLDFIQNMEYKFVELLALNFEKSPDAVIQQQVSYRYNMLKSTLTLTQARLQDIHALLKIKNPSLLLQLQKLGTPKR